MTNQARELPSPVAKAQEALGITPSAKHWDALIELYEAGRHDAWEAHSPEALDRLARQIVGTVHVLEDGEQESPGVSVVEAVKGLITAQAVGTIDAVYRAHTYGKLPEDDPRIDPEESGSKHGVLDLGTYRLLDTAKLVCEKAFDRESQQTDWIKPFRLWAPSRGRTPDRPHALWCALAAAAPRMDDPDRAWYPQMRETPYWVEVLPLADWQVP